MAKKTLYFNHEASFSQGLDGQVAHVRLNLQVDFYKFDNIPHKFVTVSLNGSAVAASQNGKLAIDRKDLRGWFTEQADVELSLSNADMKIEQDSPSTTMGSEATSSTTGITVNESLGTFGPTPTTGIGGGISIGYSFTRNLSDFKVVNVSSDNLVKHQYLMASSTGAPYNKPEDLLDMSAAGQFEGTPLFAIPDAAVANLPLISQAIFISTNPDVGDCILQVLIRHRLRKVEKTFKLFVTDVHSWSAAWTAAWRENIPLSEV